MSAHTPGPWGWFGNEYGFYLATQRGGRRFVMDFARMGMQRAQPRFQVGGVMVDAKDLAMFEVGKRGAVGMKAAAVRENEIYRTDIIGFDHADARLIAAAPELLAALQQCCDYIDCIPESAAGGDDDAIALAKTARAAIAKALGGAQ